MLSNIEQTEILRSLQPTQRLRYSLTLILWISGTFLGTVALAVFLATLFVSILNPEPLRVEEVIVIAIPVVLAFLLAIGMTRNPSRDTILPGQTAASLARAAARRGFLSGVIVGVVFGVVWSLIFQIDAIYFGVWGVQFNTSVMVFRAVMLATAVAPTLAIFRAVTSVIDDILLRQVVYVK